MKAGRLRSLIIIQIATSSVSTAGAEIETWATHAEVHAEIETLKGREYWSGAQIVTEDTKVFRVRYNELTAAVSPPRFRVLYAGQEYDIQHTDDVDERRREVLLRCVRRK